MTLEEIVNNLKSAGQDYGQLFNNNPRMDATKQFGGRAINNINSAGEGYSQWQRLQDQNFGPNQSVIASGFMHPQKGLSKLADWFTNNVNTAAGLPDPNQQDEASMYAYGPNIDQQAESGLNLAGLLQTGAFASGAAPKSAGGTLGTFIANPNRVQMNVDDYYHPFGGGVKLKNLDMSSIRVPNIPMIDRNIISPEDMFGGQLVPLIGDRTDAGKLLTHINDKELAAPVQLEGGINFMRTHGGGKNPSIWASGQGIISRLQKNIRSAAESGQDVYMPHVAMSHTGGDFSTMMADSLLEQALRNKILKRSVKEFDTSLKNIRPEWLGLNNSGSREQLYGNGALRTAFVNRMGVNGMYDKGFPELASTRAAITDPALVRLNNGDSGYGIGKADPRGLIVDNPAMPHKSYDTQLSGQYFGGLDKPVPNEIMFPDFYRTKRAEGKDHSSYTFGKTLPTQNADQEWLDGIMKYLESN